MFLTLCIGVFKWSIIVDLGWPLMLDLRSISHVYVLCVNVLDSSDCSYTTDFLKSKDSFHNKTSVL